MGKSSGSELQACVVVATMLSALILTACAPSSDEVRASDEASTTDSGTTDSSTTTEPLAEVEAKIDAQETTAEGTSSRRTNAVDTADPPEETSNAAPSSTQLEAAPSGDVIVVSDFAAFTTPAQAAYCTIGAPANGIAASISCEVAQTSVPHGDPLMGVCDAEGIGWVFNFDADSGHAGFSCNHIDGITTGGGNPTTGRTTPGSTRTVSSPCRAMPG